MYHHYPQLQFSGYRDQFSPKSTMLGSSSGSGHELPSSSPSSSMMSSGSKMMEMKDTTLISFHHMLERFIQADEHWLEIPHNMTPYQKNYFLSLVQCLNLKVKQGRNQAAVILKTGNTVPFCRMLVLGYETKLNIDNFFKIAVNNDRRSRELERLKPFTFRPGVAVLTGGTPRIPRKACSNEFKSHRESLAIYKYRQQVLDLIKNNKFSLIKGNAGVGKSTQVPQYILEDAQENSVPVRILVCLPTRAGVIAITDRVATERCEPVGQTVGYQVHLESCSSPVESLLNFVTGPVLLRALSTPGCHLLENTTHVLLDELHVRDCYQDFILTCTRDLSATNAHLKFVFLGEDLNLDFVQDYFGGVGNCPALSITGESHQVKLYYMEEILRFSWSSNNGQTTHYMHKFGVELSEEQKEENARSVHNVDSLIENVWKRVELESSLYDFIHLVRDDEISVDYAHSVTLITMLMAVSAAGFVDNVRALLDLDANIYIRSKNGYTAMEWANYFGHDQVLQVLTQKCQGLAHSPGHLPNPRLCCLRDYYRRTESDRVDLFLIVRLIHMIHSSDPSNGTILVFLPTYEEMTQLKEILCNSWKSDPWWGKENPFVIHFLHSHIQTGDQRAAFEKLRKLYRKIMLSTSIAECCLTFEDATIVIDSGKQKAHEGYNWISKAESNQRKNRAGRCGPGICYRLYTEECYENEMAEFIVPEILRCSLLGLCLQSRSLLRNEVKIEEFFQCLPTRPGNVETRAAVKTLKMIGALEEDEQLSDLGVHLLDYDIEPQWAKALLLSVVFKCMDPMLTISAYVSYGSAFIPQSHPHYRALAMLKKLDLSGGTYSDHNAILKAFQRWESLKALRDGDVDEFCAANFLSGPTFDVVYGIRSRLLGQLRASGFIRNRGANDVKDLNTNSNNWAVVKAVLTAALYPKIGVVNRIMRTVSTRNGDNVKIHASSVLETKDLNWLQELPTDWVIYDEKIQVEGRALLNGCTIVSGAAVALMAGDLSAKAQVVDIPPPPIVSGTGFTFSKRDRACCVPQVNKVCVNVDGWIRVFGFDPALGNIGVLREKLRFLVLNRLRKPDAVSGKVENDLLQMLVQVLTTEDARVGLKQSSIGQWPKLVSGNLLSTPRNGFEVSR